MLSRDIPFLTVLLLTIALGALVLPLVPGATAALQYDRSAIAAGQGWRIVTCHLTHFSVSHLMWDVIVLLGLGVIAIKLDAKQTGRTLLLAVVLIPFAIWLFQPAMQIYRGLSGLGSAVFCMVGGLLVQRAICDRRVGMAWIGRMGLGLFLVKTIYEAATGQTLFVQSADVFTPAPLAHLVGALCGLIAVISGAAIPAIRSRAFV